MRPVVMLSAAAIFLWARCTAAALQDAEVSGQKKLDVNSPRGQTDDAQYRLSVRSNLVLLPTRVQRKNGETIYGLRPDQFIVEDNGVRQPVRLEEDPDFSGLSLVAVIQCGRFAENELQKFKSLGTMIEGIVGDAPHEVAVISYGEGPYLLGDFSGSAEDVRRALAKLQRCGDFHAATIDAVYYAINMLRRRQSHYRRAILLISETRDHGSRSKIREVVTELGISDTVIYSVAYSPARDQLIQALRYGDQQIQPPPPTPTPFPPLFPRPSPTPTPSSSTTAPAEPVYLDHEPLFAMPPELSLVVNALRRSTASELASLSGGEYMNFTTQKGFEDRLQRISNQIHNYYLLSFKPASTPTFGLHSLRVRVPDYPDAVIQTRKSYWSGILDSQPADGR